MPSLTIGVLIEKTCAESVRPEWVRRAVKLALKDGGKSRGWVSVRVTDNARIRRINHRYLRHDYATDVIAFGPSGGAAPEVRSGYIGDIVVSAQKAGQVAAALKIGFEEELARYLIHGVLHLLGYRDGLVRERKRMQVRQERLVSRLKATGAAP